MAAKKKTAKRSSKKRTNKRGKRRPARITSTGVPDLTSGGNIYNLASYSVGKPNYLKTIDRVADFYAHLTDAEIAKLSDNEVEFCLGWLYLAESQYKSAKDYHGKVLKAVQKHVNSSSVPSPFSG